MSANEFNVFNESLNVLKERISGFEKIEEKDVNHLQSEINKINSEMETLNSGLKQSVDTNSENIKRLEESIKKLSEKYQDIRGELNQILLKFEYLRSEISAKDKKKNSIITNLIWPIITIIISSFIIYVASGLNQIAKMINDSNNIQKPNNIIEMK